MGLNVKADGADAAAEAMTEGTTRAAATVEDDLSKCCAPMATTAVAAMPRIVDSTCSLLPSWPEKAHVAKCSQFRNIKSAREIKQMQEQRVESC
jgi:hypothetical protein